MKAHKIPRIEKTICNAEQVIAYNISFQWIDKKSTYNKPETMDCIRITLKDISPKYNHELIYHYIDKNYYKFKSNPFTACNYEQVGKFFESDIEVN